MEIDPKNVFHASRQDRKERRLKFAPPLMDKDMSSSHKVCEANVMEGMSVICNDYVKHGMDVKRTDMPESKGLDHSASSHSGKQTHAESKERMKLLFSKMGINCDTQVSVPPIQIGSMGGLCFIIGC